MMLENFTEWLNESEPKKPPLYKVGQKVIVSGTEIPVDVYGKFKKGSSDGVYGEIKSVEGKGGKWHYMINPLAGYVRVYTSSRGPSSAFTNREIKAPQNLLQTTDVEKIEKILKSAKYKAEDNVSVSAKLKSTGDKINFVDKIKGINVKKSLEENTPCYIFYSSTLTVPESKIEDDITVDETKEMIIAEEIAKILETTILEDSYSQYAIEFDIKSYNLDDVKGTLFFKNDEEVEKFISDLNNLFKKYTRKELQLSMDGGNPTMPQVPDKSSWKKGRIERKKLKDVAKNLGINLKELFDKNRGKISGQKFGI